METALAQLADAGFDLAHTFDAPAIAHEPGLAILGGPERLGILIGNTRALWPPFTSALRDPSLAREAHPLERYTERAIDAAFSGARIYHGHRMYGAAYLPLQHLAVVTGLGALAPSRLVIHPVYGPWFALRAVVIIDGVPPTRVPIAQPCRCAAACTGALDAALANPSSGPAWVAVRDGCGLRASRYSDDQIRFHYANVWKPSE